MAWLVYCLTCNTDTPFYRGDRPHHAADQHERDHGYIGPCVITPAPPPERPAPPPDQLELDLDNATRAPPATRRRRP